MQSVQHARKTFTSSLLVLCLFVCVWLGASPVAHAAMATITLSPTSGLPTSSVKVKGSGFGASETVTITFDSTPVKQTTSSSTGTFSTRFQVPQAASIGMHTVTATGQSSRRTASAPFQVLPANWPLFGFDARHSRFNPYENILNTSNVSSLTEAWSFATGNIVYSSPAVVNGVVYVGSGDNNVYALNASTGAKLWSFATGNSIGSSPAVAGRVVYVGSDDNNVYALNASTGAKLWSFATGGPVFSSPAVANGVVYVSSRNSNVYALNASNGTRLWSFATGNSVESSPAVVNGAVYVGSDDSNVYAFKLL